MAEIRKVSCLPTFLLCIMGPMVMLSGAIFLDGVFTKPLMAPIPLTVIDSAIEETTEEDLDIPVRRLAHFLLTLRGCLTQLDANYTALKPATSIPDGELRVRPAPHLVSLESTQGLGVFHFNLRGICTRPSLRSRHLPRLCTPSPRQQESEMHREIYETI